MKTVKIKKNSWHMWLAKHGAGYDPKYHPNADRCTYVKKVAEGFMFAVLLFVLCGVVSAFLYRTGAWWFDFIAHEHSKPMSPIVLFTTLLVVVVPAVISLTVWIGKVKEARREAAYRRWEARREAPESFWTMAWRSLKEKTCARIEVED